MNKESSVTKGVSDSFDFWLSQHDISVPDLMESAIQKAMKAWLDENRERIIAAIAEKLPLQVLDMDPLTLSHPEKRDYASYAATFQRLTMSSKDE